MEAEVGGLLVIARELTEAVKLLGNQVTYLDTRLDEMNSQVEALTSLSRQLTEQVERLTAACPGL